METIKIETTRNLVKQLLLKGVLQDNKIIRERAGQADDLIGLRSIHEYGGCTCFLSKYPGGKYLCIAGEEDIGFEGIKIQEGKTTFLCSELTHENAEVLRELFSFTKPSPVGSYDLTFGVGDRLGIACTGQIRLFKKYKAVPVLAQQSVRELELTGRSYSQVIDSSTWAVFEEDFQRPWGADGDHLKEEEWVRKALMDGCTMITVDLSDHLKEKYLQGEPKKAITDFELLDESYKMRIRSEYLRGPIEIDKGEFITFSTESLSIIAITYKDALDHAERLYLAGIKVKNKFDFEISIDETEMITLPQAHFFIAMELKKKGVAFTSLAPRFNGQFQKGIDYIGDRDDFRKSISAHYSVARHFGHRLSVHSGSDKFSIFPIVGKETAGKFHIKTSGTNWLKALEVIAETNPEFYRKLHSYALEVFPIARTYYHITPDLKQLTDLESTSDTELTCIFRNPADRQVLHVSYGEILKNLSLKEELYKVLELIIERYWESLEDHIGHHLETLQVERID